MDFFTPLYRLSLSFGASKRLSGQSCKHIRDLSTNDCLPSKLYWVQEMEVCVSKALLILVINSMRSFQFNVFQGDCKLH